MTESHVSYIQHEISEQFRCGSKRSTMTVDMSASGQDNAEHKFLEIVHMTANV